MYYQSYLNYQEMYEKGLRRIQLNSWRLITNKQTLLPEKKRSFKNFILIFSPKGKLGTGYFYNYNDSQQINYVKKKTYAYDHKGCIKSIMASNLYTDELDYIAAFEYDEQGRILNENIKRFSGYSEIEKEYHHRYEKNYHAIHFFEEDVGDDLVECLHEEWYNDKGDIIEFKFWSETGGIHVWERYILNESGQTELTFNISENGKIDEVYAPGENLWTSKTLTDGKHKRTELFFKEGELSRMEEYEMKFYEVGSMDVRR